MKLLAHLLLSTIAVLCVTQVAQCKEMSLLDSSIHPIAEDGGWSPEGAKALSVSGKIFEDVYAIFSSNGCSITFDVRGWDSLKMAIGIPDGAFANDGAVDVKLDGELYKSIPVAKDKPATELTIPLSGRQTICLAQNGGFGAHIIGPKLAKSQGNNGSSSANTSRLETSMPASSASFAVDPNDLDKLAAALRKRVDGNAALKSRISTSQIGLASFALVDVLSPSVATNVAEDLSTAMINASFQLVERGQLDKVMKELGV